MTPEEAPSAPNVNLFVEDDLEAMSERAADLIAAAIREKPTLSVLVATGNTPLRTYEKLAWRRGTGLETRHLTALQLDEYVGVSEDDSRSLYGWMREVFVEPLGVTQVVRLRGDAEDTEAACRAYDHEVTECDGVDLAVLGLGPNGHLGFNEPPSDADAPTRQVTLSEASLRSNAAYWEGEVPRRALTCGMSTLLGARRTLLLVSGGHKREVLRRALQGPVTPELPASYLQNRHVTVIVDRAAWPARAT